MAETHDLPALPRLPDGGRGEAGRSAYRQAGLPTPEPMGGIEPPSTVYETVALPLSYTGLGNGGQVYSDLDSDNGSEPHRNPTLVEPTVGPDLSIIP